MQCDYLPYIGALSRLVLYLKDGGAVLTMQEVMLLVYSFTHWL